MVRAVKQHVTVQPGGVVHLQSSELPAGAQAEVIVLVEPPAEPRRTLSSFIGSAKGVYASVEEADAFIRRERDAWEC
jgi:hypothetical protein